MHAYGIFQKDMTYRKPVVSIKGTTIVNTAIQVKVLIVNIDLKATITKATKQT